MLKKISLKAIILVGVLGYCCVTQGFAQTEPDAKTLLTQMDKILRGESHKMKVHMQVKTPRWERNYRLQVWMKGIDHAFARVLEPSKVAGQGFLRVESRLWNYLPTAERTMLIPPSLMLDRFLGSDFTNDDFVKLTYFPRDYESKILEKTTFENLPVYHLELLPKPDAPVTYGKVEMWLRVEDSAPVKWEFFNDKMERIRILHYSEFKSFGAHVTPAVWTMINQEKEGHTTVIRIEEAEYGTDVPDKIFSKEHMEKLL